MLSTQSVTSILWFCILKLTKSWKLLQPPLLPRTHSYVKEQLLLCAEHCGILWYNTVAGKSYKVRGEQISIQSWRQRGRNKSKRWQLGRVREHRSRTETENKGWLRGDCTKQDIPLQIPSNPLCQAGTHLKDARQGSPTLLNEIKLILF